METATQQHVEELVPQLREGDVAEGLALGLEPLPALRASVATSAAAYALRLQGELAALFGITPLSHTALGGYGETGVVWMVSGRAVSRHKRGFLRASRAIVPRLLQHYPVLVNAIDARYTGALRWARWMGFEVAPSVPLGPYGLPFHPFTIRRQAWAG